MEQEILISLIAFSFFLFVSFEAQKILFDEALFIYVVFAEALSVISKKLWPASK